MNLSDQDFADLIIKRNDKYWENQWLIGYYSDTANGRQQHDFVVAQRG